MKFIVLSERGDLGEDVAEEVGAEVDGDKMTDPSNL